MSAPLVNIHSGLSVLVNDVFNLNPNVNLLPGATIFYSAYPAEEGKVGIYTRWEGEQGAQRAVHGIRNGRAPRSSTWRQAVNVLHSRYTELNPPGSGITSVLVIPDNDDDDGDTSAGLSAGNSEEGALGSVLNLLDSLPTHVLEAARHRRPPSIGAVSIHSAAPLSKTSLTGRTVEPPPHGDRVALAQFSTPAKPKPLSAKPNTVSKTLDVSPSKTSSSPSHRPHTSNNSAPHTAFPTVRSPASRSTASTSRTLIDSPVRGAGIGLFMAPSPEAYTVGHWTETVLDFIKCREAVVPIVETHLPRFSNDEDDIEFQAVLSETFTVELSHLVVKLLKLDAFLKTLGERT